MSVAGRGANAKPNKRKTTTANAAKCPYLDVALFCIKKFLEIWEYGFNHHRGRHSLEDSQVRF
jgi:hypothetical protein